MSAGFVRNATYMTISSSLLKIVAFLYFGFIANILNPDQTGQFFIVLAIFGILGVFDDFGTSSWLIRHIASSQSIKESLPRIISIKLIATPIALILAFLIPYFFNYSQEITTLILLGMFVLLADTISQTNFSILRGERLLKYESFGIFIGQAITTCTGIILILSWHASPYALVVALILGSIWNAFYSTYQIVIRNGWSIYIPTIQGVMPILIGSSAFFLANIFTKIFSYADTFFISKLMDEYHVGIYGVAYKLTFAFQFLPLALVAALYPALSNAIHDDAKSRTLIEGALTYLSLLVFPIVAGIYAIAPELVSLYAKPEYGSAVGPLRIMIFSLIFAFLDFPIGAILNARMQQKTKTIIMGLTLVLNIILNLILIPLYGLLGASISAVLSFLFMFGIGWIIVQRTIHIRITHLLRIIGIPAIASFIMAMIVMNAHVHIYISIMLGACVYGVIIFGTKYITWSDLKRGWMGMI